ncbi:hypothetical protein [Streptomyces sp. NBC_00483]|uniref:hypothetical protein n=1 Tax=Streptomyces sp. NBC_00483 TaxID=2975756 RepID=UPI002E181A79
MDFIVINRDAVLDESLSDIELAHHFKPARPCDDCGQAFETAALYIAHHADCPGLAFSSTPFEFHSATEIEASRRWRDGVVRALTAPATFWGGNTK